MLNANVAVYRGDGKLVAAAGKAPDPLSAQRARDLGKHTMLHGRGRRGMTLAVILEGQAGAYLIIGHRQGHGGCKQEPHPSRFHSLVCSAKMGFEVHP